MQVSHAGQLLHRRRVLTLPGRKHGNLRVGDVWYRLQVGFTEDRGSGDDAQPHGLRSTSRDRGAGPWRHTDPYRVAEQCSSSSAIVAYTSTRSTSVTGGSFSASSLSNSAEPSSRVLEAVASFKRDSPGDSQGSARWVVRSLSVAGRQNRTVLGMRPVCVWTMHLPCSLEHGRRAGMVLLYVLPSWIRPGGSCGD